MLEEPKKAGSKVLSHMLSSHGGEQMFLLYIACFGIFIKHRKGTY